MNLHSIKPANIFLFTVFEKRMPFVTDAINSMLCINNSETVKPQSHPPRAEN